MDDKDKLNEIIAGCRCGDNDAFSRLIDIFGGQCYGYFYRVTGNAEISNDLLSELFIKLVEKIDLYNDGSFKKWLFTVASNIFHDYLRGLYRQRKMITSKTENAPNPVIEQVNMTDMKDELQVYLSKLEGDTSELLMLRYFSQLSFKEIAELRGEPIGTTLAKVHRGLKRLRELMEKTNE